MSDDWRMAVAVWIYGPMIVAAAGGCCGASTLAALLHTFAAWW